MEIAKGTVVVVRNAEAHKTLYGKATYDTLSGVVVDIRDNKVEVVFPWNITDKPRQSFDVNDVIPVITIEDYLPQKTSTEEIESELRFRFGEALINLGKQILETEVALQTANEEWEQKYAPRPSIYAFFRLVVSKIGGAVPIITDIGHKLLDYQKILSEIPRIPKIFKGFEEDTSQSPAQTPTK